MSAGALSDDSSTGTRFDDADRHIIERLQADGRVAFAALATDLGLREEDVTARVDALLGAGVIRIVAVTDPLQLGYHRQAMLGVVTDETARAVGEAISLIDEVIYLARTSGEFDLLAEVVGRSDVELLELVTRIRRLPGVQRIHTFLYQELVKETYEYGTA